MSEMVERVAKAMVDEDGDYTVRDHHRRRARAAIAAMREPTQRMLEVGRRGPNREYMWDHDALVAWQDMVDEALK